MSRAAGLSITDTPDAATETVSSTLVVNPVTHPAHSGPYSCEFLNNAGTRSSSSGLITVHGKSQAMHMKKATGFPKLASFLPDNED